MQLGPGIFTANALPPYRTWREFRALLSTGVAALLRTRDPAEQQLSLRPLVLRYINAFSAAILGDKSPSAFVSEVLGFRVTIPEAVRKHVVPDGAVSEFVQLGLRTANTTHANIIVGEAMMNGAPVAILDLSITSTVATSPEVGAVLDQFDAANAILHDCTISCNCTRWRHSKKVRLTAKKSLDITRIAHYNSITMSETNAHRFR